MKLKQTLVINGISTSQESTGDIFGLLQVAQWELASQRPDLDPLWLQHHPNFLHYLGCLAHAGKVNVFSLQDQVDMNISWNWVARVPNLIEVEPLVPDAGHVPTPVAPEEAPEMPTTPLRSDCLTTWVELTEVEVEFWNGVKASGQVKISEDSDRCMIIFGMGPLCPPECQVWMEDSPDGPGDRFHIPLAEAKNHWAIWGSDAIGEFPRECAPSPSPDFEQI